MAYNKASEERKWHYWKEREEKKLRELGMDEEKIRKLRQMDWEDFLEERRYRERLCIRPLSAAIRAAFSGQTGPY